jgi:spore coat protein U-like protein
MSISRITFLSLMLAFWLPLLAGKMAPVQAGANPPCTVSMTNVSFGSFSLTSSNVDTTATMSATCPSGGGPDQYVCLSIEAGSSGDATSRKMLNGSDTLRYDLYKDAARTQLWGSWESGYAGTGTQTIVVRGSTVNLTVYARVFGSQSSPAGSYTSTFTVSPYLSSKDNTGGPSCPRTENTHNSSFTVSATVLASCSVSASNLNFGTTGLLTSNIDAANSLSVTCATGTAYNVGLSAGNGSGATMAARKMTKASTTNTTTYSLYRNAARTQVWGTTIGTDTQSGTGTGSAQSLTVYGRVPSQTTPPPGVYTDTIVVTVTY